MEEELKGQKTRGRGSRQVGCWRHRHVFLRARSFRKKNFPPVRVNRQGHTRKRLRANRRMHHQRYASVKWENYATWNQFIGMDQPGASNDVFGMDLLFVGQNQQYQRNTMRTGERQIGSSSRKICHHHTAPHNPSGSTALPHVPSLEEFRTTWTSSTCTPKRAIPVTHKTSFITCEVKMLR